MTTSTTDRAPATTGQRRLLLAVVGVGLLLRVGAVLWVQSVDPSLARTLDTTSYVDSAHHVVDQRQFLTAGATEEPMLVRTPGYPLFLALVFQATGGENQTMVLILQALIGAAVIPLAYLLARRLSSIRVAILGALFVALDPFLVVSVTQLMTDWLAALAVTALAYAGVRLLMAEAPRDRYWSAAGLGASIAASAFVRPTMYWFAVPAFLFAAANLRKRRVGLKVGALALTLLVVPLLSLGAWQVRNHVEGDTWRFTTIDAVNMYSVVAPA